MYWIYQALSALARYRNTQITYLKFVLELAGDVLVASEAMPDRNHRLTADTLAWLRANRVKQKELAESLGVTPQHMNDILGGRTHLTGEHEPSPCSAGRRVLLRFSHRVDDRPGGAALGKKGNHDNGREK